MVRYHRERSRMTQAQLAEKAGRSFEMVGRIERGDAAPSLETLAALSEALEVPVREFFGVGDYAARLDGDPLAAVVGRLVALDPADLRWAEELLKVALSRKSRA